jgi:tRNA (mo5U34)-methyltransferase
MTPGELRAAVAALPWWHRMDLGHGIVTPGQVDTPALLPLLHLPERLDGLTVLDIGAWDGFYAFECERRGAARVLATDSHCWTGPGWGDKRAFELARRALGSRVEDLDIDVMDLAPERVGTFDVVLFLGVLYHLRHPLLGLERAASVTRGRLIVETHIDLLDIPGPAMRFYPGPELNGDSTNWWGPNLECVADMLRAVGLDQVHVAPRRPNWPRAVFHALRSAKRGG